MAWTTVKASDIAQESLRRGPHRGELLRVISRLCCKQCGLVLLKNDVSRRAWKKQCEY